MWSTSVTVFHSTSGKLPRVAWLIPFSYSRNLDLDLSVYRPNKNITSESIPFFNQMSRLVDFLFKDGSGNLHLKLAEQCNNMKRSKRFSNINYSTIVSSVITKKSHVINYVSRKCSSISKYQSPVRNQQLVATRGTNSNSFGEPWKMTMCAPWCYGVHGSCKITPVARRQMGTSLQCYIFSPFLKYEPNLATAIAWLESR